MNDLDFQSGGAIPESAIPENLRPRIGPASPERARLLVARAVLPMPPQELGLALGVLARDASAEIAAAAKASLKELPEAVVHGVATSEAIPGPVLDSYAHEFPEDPAVLQRLVANRVTLDETVRWMARNLRGSILDVIASNQVRLVRAPQIIEAMIANPSAPTPVLARVIETALRSHVDTSKISGFKALAQAFFADLHDQLRGPEAEAPEAAPAETAAEPAAPEGAATPEEALFGAGVEAKGDDPLLAALLAAGGAPLESLVAGAGADESELEALLTATSGEELDESAMIGKKPMWKLIEEMSLPQKVRLALMGDASARKVLVRDKKKMVSLSVLKSPKITYKEVATFASDKSLDGELIGLIARNREWTKQYTVMHALVLNPKTPTNVALHFIKNLQRRDLQNLSKAKDVPGHISRSAKQLLDKRASD